MLGLAAVSIVVGVVVAVLMGGYERRTAVYVCVGTALAFGGFVFLDELLRNWGSFVEMKPRPISTIGSGEPGFEGNFWEQIWNWGVQLILPTIVLTVISLASYSRYTRSSMLETTQQDYIRTARSKGLSDRVINTRHALRNALIPITTIVAFDFAALIGGAVVTERVFGWSGMGAMFQEGLNNVDPGPVMAFYLVTGTAAVLMNMAGRHRLRLARPADPAVSAVDRPPASARPRLDPLRRRFPMTDNDDPRPDERRPDEQRPPVPGTGDERLSPSTFFQADPAAPQHVDELDRFSVEKPVDLQEKSYSQGQLVRRRFFRHKGALVSLGVLVGITRAGGHLDRLRGHPRLVGQVLPDRRDRGGRRPAHAQPVAPEPGRAPLRPGQHRQGLLRADDARSAAVAHHRVRRRAPQHVHRHRHRGDRGLLPRLGRGRPDARDRPVHRHPAAGAGRRGRPRSPVAASGRWRSP